MQTLEQDNLSQTPAFGATKIVLEPAVHGMGAPTGTHEAIGRRFEFKILAQCPDLGRDVASGEAPGDTPRGPSPEMSPRN